MSLDHYHVRLHAPYGISEQSGVALGTPLRLPNQTLELPLAHHLALALLSAFHETPFSFGVCCLGWAHAQRIGELERILVRLQALTGQGERNLVRCDGAGRKLEAGELRYLYAYPLNDLPEPERYQAHLRVNPFDNAERTHQIIEECSRSFVADAPGRDVLGILYAVAAESLELCGQKLDEITTILNLQGSVE